MKRYIKTSSIAYHTYKENDSDRRYFSVTNTKYSKVAGTDLPDADILIISDHVPTEEEIQSALSNNGIDFDVRHVFELTDWELPLYFDDAEIANPIYV